MNVLNPTLYRQLVRRFGECKVSNSNEAMICKAVKTGDDEDRPQLRIEHSGEYYQVCCPYCSDTRHRLYVNHRFGQTDAFGRRLLFLAICYNEGCLGRRENFVDFLEQLDNSSVAEARVKPGKIVPEEAREVIPPGPTILLKHLRRTHPARVYVSGRGFDVTELSDKYGVSYCSQSRYTLARNRLIIPVVEKGKLKGWQARYVGELDWKGPLRHELPPKYFSCPDSHFRSRCLLSWESVREWHTGIIVEGPFDAFRFGSMSCCIFGNSMTVLQKRKFAAIFRKRSGVLLLDPSECDSKQTHATLEFFRKQMPGNFCAVKLPDNTDPGSLDRSFLKAYVKEQAAMQGVKVRYKRVVTTK